MGIFSFGKKDDAPTRRGANSSSSRGSRAERTERAERVERRSRRTDRSGDADAMLLDPTLPEKQRARRRLVGAIALVIAAVVILPMVLDSHPKPVTDDISIDIPSRPAPKPRASVDSDTQAAVAPDNPAAPDAALAASGLAPAASGAAATGAVASQRDGSNSKNAPIAVTPAKPQAPAVVANNAPAAKPAAKPQADAKPAAKPEQKPAATETAQAAASGTETGTPAAPPGSRFAVQLGAFQDDASAHAWATKLKAAGVPAYTERRKQADGSSRTLLRAGPFADRAAASAAIAKVREAGLTSGANNGAAQ
ncbi:UNVERIFIED_ORG: DedD protein [Burkholderia sp. CF145]|uniref:SPOR domain-containing protein n=1 Tax=Paraburkholderia hospita TaxID=169430 RepID=UPI000271C696|nr:SPOR domain-containing protein [Paraburkholderia hospita]EUC18293.1 Sporulation domain-containing protein [Burkholderia sp. BT03]SKC76191.1 Cell division protein DedD (protein involved in septation) [Paraburkholderia hospita]